MLVSFSISIDVALAPALAYWNECLLLTAFTATYAITLTGSVVVNVIPACPVDVFNPPPRLSACEYSPMLHSSLSANVFNEFLPPLEATVK